MTPTIWSKKRPLVAQRENEHKPQNFQIYLEDYCAAKTDKEIHDKDSYNFDETGIWVGVEKDWLGYHTSARLFMLNYDNW